MSTRRELHLPTPPTPSRSAPAARPRLLAAIGAAKKAVRLLWPVKSASPAATPAPFHAAPVHAAGRIAVLSSAGMPAWPQRSLRPPGVRSRWKASDRVPLA